MNRPILLSVSAIRRLACAVPLAAGLALAAAVITAGQASAAPTTVSFTTAGCSTWALPADVTAVQIQATGAAGGNTYVNTYVRNLGGHGDGVSATLAGLSAGQVLDVCVDYGGGTAGISADTGSADGGSGGGASGVSLGSDFSSPVLVAGGGGGAGPDGAFEPGGNAGYPAGGAGVSNINQAAAGGGGTQTAGGAGGTDDASTGGMGLGFTASGPGTGGAGGNAFGGGGGGGGAGYYGGGGAGGGNNNGEAGGGGGSDFCTDTAAPAVTGCSFSAGAGTGTGAVTITYPAVLSTMTTLTSSADTSEAGQQVTYTATVSPVPDGGTVAFTDGTTTIAGCGAVTVSSTGTATCPVTYTGPGSHPVTAAYSGDATYQASTSAGLTQRVAYKVQPQYSQAKASTSGSTVPVKIQLLNAAGTNLSAAATTITVTGLSPSPAPGKTPAGTFTFVALDQGPGYQLNVKTTGYPKGTYTLSFTVSGDPTVHTVQFVIS